MDGPFRILALVPQPIDAAWASAAAAAWGSLAVLLENAVDAGAIELVRLTPATANELEERLQRKSFHAIHVVSRGTSRPAARHGTVTLEASDRRARDLNAQNFARPCAQLEVVVLQTVGGATTGLDVVRDTLVQQTAPVVCVPGDTPISAATLYAGLSLRQPLEVAFRGARELGDARSSSIRGREPSHHGRRVSRASLSGRPRRITAPRHLSRPDARPISIARRWRRVRWNASACRRHSTCSSATTSTTSRRS
jgi:hypothetical protein